MRNAPEPQAGSRSFTLPIALTSDALCDGERADEASASVVERARIVAAGTEGTQVVR
jgi:hypothetical protein